MMEQHITRAEHLPEGLMNLICLGGQRFRVLRIVQQDPYLVGDVEVLTTAGEDDPEIADLADRAGALFAEYTRLYLAMSNQWARTIEMPGAPGSGCMRSCCRCSPSRRSDSISSTTTR